MENIDIGFKIKKLREEKNLSQEQLANLLEISQSKLSKIENGRLKKIEMKLVLKFCKNIDDLMIFLRIQKRMSWYNSLFLALKTKSS